jgi:hypothetical protein
MRRIAPVRRGSSAALLRVINDDWDRTPHRGAPGTNKTLVRLPASCDVRACGDNGHGSGLKKRSDINRSWSGIVSWSGIIYSRLQAADTALQTVGRSPWAGLALAP